MAHNCKHRCIMPASPELEEKIIRTRRALHDLKSSNKLLSEFKPEESMLDLNSYLTIINRPAKTFPDTLVAPTSEFVPIIGIRRTIVLLVDFSDFPASEPISHFNDILFSQGTFFGGSMRDYYKEVSYGNVDVQGEVFGWYRAPHPKTYYTNNENGFGAYPMNAQKLVEDTIDLANNDVNFAPYDNTGDGTVQALVIIAAGSGAEQTGNKSDIWSHKWDIVPKTVDGVRIEKYFMAPEDGRIGVMSHELGHLLMSWPDLYDIDYSSRGTGNWDLMAGGSWNNYGNTPAHPSAWCKVQAGWVTPKVIVNKQENVVITPYHTNADVYKLPVNGDESSKEYFLLSNRKNEGFDYYLPGEGLIIEHIDDNQSNNTDENHYLVDIEQADGQRNLNLNFNSGDASDAFPTDSNNNFGTNSTPNSKTYSDQDSFVQISEITRTGDNISAKVKAGQVAPSLWVNDLTITQTYANSIEDSYYLMIQGESAWKKVTGNSSNTALFNAACIAAAYSLKADLLMDSNEVYAIKIKSSGSLNTQNTNFTTGELFPDYLLVNLKKGG